MSHIQNKNVLNLVDETYELIDPHPDIHELFVLFDQQFFWGTLTSRACTVDWSKRMTSCAGICQFHGRNGLCSIRLSEPLLKLRKRRDLVETLLHEMIHAYLFLTGGMRFMDRDGHGPEFQSHMHRINELSGTSITIYHSFHAEVSHYQKHWWRCTGPCQHRAPYHGWVKRASNRAPGPNDFWWKQHQMSCDGTFVKVKEPEKKEKPKTSRKKNDKELESTAGTSSKSGTKRKLIAVDPKQPKIDQMFSGDKKLDGYSVDEGDEVSVIAEIKRPQLDPIDNKALFPGKGYRLDGR